MTDNPVPSQYRPDIDGLRAIAVVSVMIFHAHHALLPGGFVGVDIFFVISGYLICKHIAGDVLHSRFSFAEFYRRRIRRIVPMMMTVVAATLVVAFLIMTPEDGQAVAKSAVWSIASMANVHFWRDLDTGYFANSSAEVPLLHLWSLGVEEQFYFIWPLVLVLGMKSLRPPFVLAAMALVALGSFHWASRTFDTDASFAYYMLPTRMGELLLGAIVGVGAASGAWRFSAFASRCAGWAGAMLVAGSMVLLSRDSPFPGWLAFPPTLGAALLILAGERHRQPVPGLTTAPMVFIGRISYSAYLWHWPLFAFFRYGYGEPGAVSGSVLFVSTLALAWLSYRFIELPTRSSRAPLRVVALRQFIAPALALTLPCLLMVYGGKIGVPLASATYTNRLLEVRATTRPAFTFDWVCQRQRLTTTDTSDPRCVLGAPGHEAPHAVLWGDSNSAHYVPMLVQIAARAGVRFRNFSVGSCPPIFTDPAPYVSARRLSDCVASAEVGRKELERYPVVLISAAWSSYSAASRGFMKDVRETVRDLAANGHHVILIGRAPVLASYDRRCTEKALRVPFKTCPEISEPLALEVLDANRELRAIAESESNVEYFDANQYLCPKGICTGTTAKGAPRFLDASHLTVAGATELGQAVLADEGIPTALLGFAEQ